MKTKTKKPKPKDTPHYVYDTGAQTLTPFANRRGAVRAMLRDGGHREGGSGKTLYVVREAEDAWEVWDGIDVWGKTFLRGDLMVLCSFYRFRPWDARVVQC